MKDIVKDKAEEMLARIIEYSYTAYGDNSKRHEELMTELACSLITSVSCSCEDMADGIDKLNEVLEYINGELITSTIAYYAGNVDYKIIGEDI
jgi:hypothetical protein